MGRGPVARVVAQHVTRRERGALDLWKIPCGPSSDERREVTTQSHQVASNATEHVIWHAARPDTRNAQETHIVSCIADDIADDTAV